MCRTVRPDWLSAGAERMHSGCDSGPTAPSLGGGTRGTAVSTKGFVGFISMALGHEGYLRGVRVPHFPKRPESTHARHAVREADFHRERLHNRQMGRALKEVQYRKGSVRVRGSSRSRPLYAVRNCIGRTWGLIPESSQSGSSAVFIPALSSPIPDTCPQRPSLAPDASLLPPPPLG